MATAGTLLSDLNKDSSAPIFNQDDDLVNKILADMNVPSQQNPVMAPPPPAGHGNRMISAPNPNTMYPHTMDPATSTAHLIGKDYPSAADFANVLHPMAPGHGHGGSAYAQAGPPPAPHQAYPALLPTSSPLYSEIIAQIKQPLMVALIVFLTSLPALHVLIGYYLPSMIRIGGDLTTAGLVVKALVGGFLFWFTQRILVPLMV